MLGIRRHRAGRAETVELDALRMGHGGDGALQGLGVEMLAHLHQRVQGGVEDLQAEVRHRVALVDRELAETGPRGEALRQLQLEVLEPAAADGAAEAHDGRLADADAVGQVGHGGVHHGCGVAHHVIGDLEFRFAEQMTRLGNVLQQIHRMDSAMIVRKM
ncbi:hypothetical protein D9M71_413120 [compost metagenome]